jgi:hypothetical protein
MAHSRLPKLWRSWLELVAPKVVFRYPLHLFHHLGNNTWNIERFVSAIKEMVRGHSSSLLTGLSNQDYILVGSQSQLGQCHEEFGYC